MKLYFAIVDEHADLITHVAANEPMDLLRQVFVSLPTGEFELGKRKITERVEEINHIFNTVFAGLTTPIEVIDYISRTVTAKGRDEEVAEQLAEALLLYGLADDGPNLVDFLSDLREIFAGTSYEMSSAIEDLTFIIVRIEM